MKRPMHLPMYVHMQRYIHIRELWYGGVVDTVLAYTWTLVGQKRATRLIMKKNTRFLFNGRITRTFSFYIVGLFIWKSTKWHILTILVRCQNNYKIHNFLRNRSFLFIIKKMKIFKIAYRYLHSKAAAHHTCPVIWESISQSLTVIEVAHFFSNSVRT